MILDRETVLEEDNIQEILDSGVQTVLLHKEDANTSDYSIIFNTLQKDTSNSEKGYQYIYRQLRRRRPPDDATRAKSSPTFSSLKSVMTSAKWAVTVSIKLGLTTSMDVKV